MFSRLIGLIAVISVSYILAVFALPSIADQYWDAYINAKIRNIKDASLKFASGSDSVQSLADTIKNTTAPYINETKKAVEDINATVTNKVNQVQDAAAAVQSAYSGVIDAKNKIQNLTETGI
jgi:methyl-accepting chemotaxis protein